MGYSNCNYLMAFWIWLKNKSQNKTTGFLDFSVIDSFLLLFFLEKKQIKRRDKNLISVKSKNQKSTFNTFFFKKKL